MFSKLFAFGFAALTLALVPAEAVSGLQMPMKISCGIEVQSVCYLSFLSLSSLTVREAGGSQASGLENGIYFIFNVATDTLVRSFVADTPAAVSYANERPGPFGQWNVVQVGDGVFNISNKGLGLPTYIGDDGGIYSGKRGPPSSFVIEPAEFGYYVVRSLDEDLVWTVEDVDAQRSPVKLTRFAGDDAQLMKTVEQMRVRVRVRVGLLEQLRVATLRIEWTTPSPSTEDKESVMSAMQRKKKIMEVPSSDRGNIEGSYAGVLERADIRYAKPRVRVLERAICKPRVRQREGRVEHLEEKKKRNCCARSRTAGTSGVVIRRRETLWRWERRLRRATGADGLQRRGDVCTCGMLSNEGKDYQAGRQKGRMGSEDQRDVDVRTNTDHVKSDICDSKRTSGRICKKITERMREFEIGGETARSWGRTSALRNACVHGGREDAKTSARGWESRRREAVACKRRVGGGKQGDDGRSGEAGNIDGSGAGWTGEEWLWGRMHPTKATTKRRRRMGASSDEHWIETVNRNPSNEMNRIEVQLCNRIKAKLESKHGTKTRTHWNPSIPE
ncbi:hypothetical protein C8R45DRAFT_1180967 [Mycena sanguinolenta]|nr:hypothetical protein C8R45DRAFT_1180967 [Mycena sanguinolenta]